LEVLFKQFGFSADECIDGEPTILGACYSLCKATNDGLTIINRITQPSHKNSIFSLKSDV
jgi:hypothetical protein